MSATCRTPGSILLGTVAGYKEKGGVKERLTRHFPIAGACFVAELIINPAAAAKDDKTASIFKREYQRYVDVFSCSSISTILAVSCWLSRTRVDLHVIHPRTRLVVDLLLRNNRLLG